jgi:hypothetical protein
VHWKLALQTLGRVQVPQLPPQPSEPQFLPALMQSGTQAGGVHWKLALQTLGRVQVPQLPPQPSEPQFLPALMQSGTQINSHKLVPEFQEAPLTQL